MGLFSGVANFVSDSVNTFSNVIAAPAIAAGKVVGQEDLARSLTSFSNPINFIDAQQRRDVLLPAIGKSLPFAASVATGSVIPATLAYSGDSLNKFGLGGNGNAMLAAKIAGGDYEGAGIDFVNQKLIPKVFPTEAESPNISGNKLQAAQNFGGQGSGVTKLPANWIIIGSIFLVPVLLYFIFRKKKGK